MKRSILFTLLLGCGAIEPQHGTPTPDSGVTCVAPNLNPYGVCYPTDIGSQKGTAVPNFCFDGVKPFCFAQLYDPAGTLGIKLIHVVEVSVWAPTAIQEVDAITGNGTQGKSWATDLAPKGIMFVILLVEGPVAGTGATMADVQSFIAKHPSTSVPMGLDPTANKLGVYWNTAAIPMNIDIDARTMHFIGSSAGFDPNLDQTLITLVASL
jgi:hypothetical protein